MESGVHRSIVNDDLHTDYRYNPANIKVYDNNYSGSIGVLLSCVRKTIINEYQTIQNSTLVHLTVIKII